jgi:GT2 family glycosyltransferase
MQRVKQDARKGKIIVSISVSEQEPSVSIIVVSYNTREMTLACIDSVRRETSVWHEIIVVDNNSLDGSADAIRSRFPEVTLIAEDVNHGFARAHEIALPLCRSSLILLLNPDTVVIDGAIDKLLSFSLDYPNAGIWGGRTLYPDGSLNPYSCWRQMTTWSLFCRLVGLTAIFPSSEFFNSETYGHWQRDCIREVDIVTGCLLLISRASWDRLGGFDPIFRMYGEEADLCLRARKSGMRPAITPAATIIHYGGASETVRSDKMVRLLKAKTELIKRHFSSFTRRPALVLLALWPLSRKLGFKALYQLRGDSVALQRAEEWGQVWQRRAEWKSGF